MLWLKFIFGLKIFKPVRCLFLLFQIMIMRQDNEKYKLN